jgi:hypothetical protein
MRVDEVAKKCVFAFRKFMTYGTFLWRLRSIGNSREHDDINQDRRFSSFCELTAGHEKLNAAFAELKGRTTLLDLIRQSKFERSASKFESASDNIASSRFIYIWQSSVIYGFQGSGFNRFDVVTTRELPESTVPMNGAWIGTLES